MSTFIVRERSDGRGGIKPFNTYTAKQAGAYVTVGNTKIKVTSDGRINIPKEVMHKYGVKGDDGRYRLGITFATKAGKDSWKDVKAVVKTPPNDARNQKQGTTIKMKKGQITLGKLKPSDAQDYTWSN